MIAIVRPSQAPAVLGNRGVSAATGFRLAYNAAPADYRLGTQSFEFDNTIYAHEYVKKALRAAQHDKCAFCESKFSTTGYGDVEHFRPKGGFKQRASDALGRPGYYWLAYEWTNLLVSCQLCNQKFKGNLFPLKRVGRRAVSHHDALSREEPLLVDPSSERPEKFLTFHQERAVPVRGWRKGTTTIEVLGLNRVELLESRRERLQMLKLLLACRDQLQQSEGERPSAEEAELLRELNDTLTAAVQDETEYAAMKRMFLVT